MSTERIAAWACELRRIAAVSMPGAQIADVLSTAAQQASIFAAKLPTSIHREG
jgi:hypothetical protein